MQQHQQQWQGPERRQSQSQYTGEERRKARSEESASLPGMSTQDRKDDQQDRAAQQARDQTDTH